MFPIAVWYQPISLMPAWAALGINTVVGCELESVHSPAQLVAAAGAAGLSIWPTTDQLRPVPPSITPTLQLAANVPGFLMVPDEPDGAGAKSPSDIQAARNIVRLSTSKPLMLSLDANKMPWLEWSAYQQYAAAVGDIPGSVIMEDFYPTNTKGSIDDKRSRIRFLRASALPGQQVWSAIECSDQNLGRGGRGPTPDETAAQIDMALAEGVDGIMYFPTNVTIGWPAGFMDGVTPAMRTMMKTKNAQIQAEKSGAVIQVPPIAMAVSIAIPGFKPISIPLTPLQTTL